VEEAQVLEYRPEKRAVLMEHFGIGEAEILAVGEAKLPELVLERVALVDVLK
jgi:KEOPS complex subunit Cgi121